MSCLRNVTLLCAALMAPPLVVAQTVEAPWVAEARQVSMAVPPKLPLVLLHASLAWRVAGSLLDSLSLTSQGGMANAIALLLFIATKNASVVRGRRDSRGAA